MTHGDPLPARMRLANLEPSAAAGAQARRMLDVALWQGYVTPADLPLIERIADAIQSVCGIGVRYYALAEALQYRSRTGMVAILRQNVEDRRYWREEHRFPHPMLSRMNVILAALGEPEITAEEVER